MRKNPDLLEKKNHAHYAACLGRKNAIDKYCRSLFTYSLVACLMMTILTLSGIRIVFITWIPELIGYYTDALPMFVQLLEIAGIFALAVFGFGKYKMCNVISFLIFACIMFFSLFEKNALVRYFSLVLGVAGVIRYYKALPTMLDYRQLTETEGFPHFNERFIGQEENKDYKSIHDRKCYTDPSSSSMVQPDFMEETVFTGKDVVASMPDMPELSAAPSNASGNAAEYVPPAGKFCRISESPIKTT